MIFDDVWRCLDNIVCNCPVPFAPLHGGQWAIEYRCQFCSSVTLSAQLSCPVTFPQSLGFCDLIKAGLSFSSRCLLCPFSMDTFIYTWCNDVHNQMTEFVTRTGETMCLVTGPQLTPCTFGLNLGRFE